MKEATKSFPWLLTNLHRLINGRFETIRPTFDWNFLI
jgi:hypothetical protein